MPYDLVIRNGMVVDGSGFSRYRADVAVTDGRIAEIGRIRGSARQTIDAEGLFVAPGIIDLHTHYDVQPFWDRLCTSSVWHGVTTVLTGNCGLTLAPLRPEHRETMLATFCCVEDLPVSSLRAVLPWTWQSFDEFLKAIDIGLGVNFMPLVGHNPLRLSAMDKAAWEKSKDAWLPSSSDGDFIESLMQPQFEPAKFASWIAPPKVGIDNKPGDFEYVKIADA